MDVKLVILAVIFAMSPESGGSASGEVDPCRVVTGPRDYAGQRILIRGKLEWSREGGGLVFPACPESMTTAGHAWSKGMALRLMDDSGESGGRTPDQTD